MDKIHEVEKAVEKLDAEYDEIQKGIDDLKEELNKDFPTTEEGLLAEIQERINRCPEWKDEYSAGIEKTVGVIVSANTKIGFHAIKNVTAGVERMSFDDKDGTGYLLYGGDEVKIFLRPKSGAVSYRFWKQMDNDEGRRITIYGYIDVFKNKIISIQIKANAFKETYAYDPYDYNCEFDCLNSDNEPTDIVETVVQMFHHALKETK